MFWHAQVSGAGGSRMTRGAPPARISLEFGGGVGFKARRIRGEEVEMKTMMMQVLVVLTITFGLSSVCQAQAMDYKATYNGTVLDTSFDTNADGSLVDVVRGSGKGTFGQSDSVVVTEFLPLGVTGECESEDDFRLMVIDNRGVTTYSKGEQLILLGTDGYLCLDFATGEYEGMASGTFDGGTGRFENAYGDWESRFSGRNLTFPVGLPYGFGSINGLTTGTLYLK
jgi:hypothetical protein